MENANENVSFRDCALRRDRNFRNRRICKCQRGDAGDRSPGSQDWTVRSRRTSAHEMLVAIWAPSLPLGRPTGAALLVAERTPDLPLMTDH